MQILFYFGHRTIRVMAMILAMFFCLSVLAVVYSMSIEDLGLFFGAISVSVISLFAMNTDMREIKTDLREIMAKTTSSSAGSYSSISFLLGLIVGTCIIFAYLTSKYNHRRFWAPIGRVTGVQICSLVTNRNEAATLMAANQRAEADAAATRETIRIEAATLMAANQRADADATVAIEAVAETVVTLTTAYATLTALPADVVNLAALNGTLTAEVATLRGENATLVGVNATLEGRVVTLEAEVATYQGVNATLEGRIETLHARLDVEILQIRNILQI